MLVLAHPHPIPTPAPNPATAFLKVPLLPLSTTADKPPTTKPAATYVSEVSNPRVRVADTRDSDFVVVVDDDDDILYLLGRIKKK